jgi:hypothetical protein
VRVGIDAGHLHRDDGTVWLPLKRLVERREQYGFHAAHLRLGARNIKRKPGEGCDSVLQQNMSVKIGEHVFPVFFLAVARSLTVLWLFSA